MRLPRLFKRRPYTATAAAAALVGAMSCVGGGGSTNASPIQASLQAIGTLVLTNCSAVNGNASESCNFSGSMINNGPGCAGDISGVTVSSDSTGSQVGTADWTFAGTLLAGATGTYTGTGLLVPGNNAPSNYHTTFTFTSVVCPS
jgi:hypothetical protein